MHVHQKQMALKVQSILERRNEAQTIKTHVLTTATALATILAFIVFEYTWKETAIGSATITLLAHYRLKSSVDPRIQKAAAALANQEFVQFAARHKTLNPTQILKTYDLFVIRKQ
jgi:hypothetical protein